MELDMMTIYEGHDCVFYNMLLAALATLELVSAVLSSVTSGVESSWMVEVTYEHIRF